MKKLPAVLVASTMLLSSSHAQTYQAGQAAQSSTTEAKNSFAWGIGLGALVVMGVMVGFIVWSSSE